MQPVLQIGELTGSGQIPFTVNNMQAAYTRLRKNPSAAKHPNDVVANQKSTYGYEIGATHYYYRFLPQDSTSYKTLINDKVLLVSDLPFEYDYKDDATIHIDPAIASVGNPFTYYYFVVPIDYEIPSGLDYTKLAELHFTPEDEYGDELTPKEELAVDFYHDLNVEAQFIAEQLSDEEMDDFYYFAPNEPVSISYSKVLASNIAFSEYIIDFSSIDAYEKRRSWRPSGRITVDDDFVTNSLGLDGTVGVRNAEIRVRKWGWLPLRTTETFKTGHFITRSTKTKSVKYAIHFHPNDKRFNIKAGTIFWGARHVGTNKYTREKWNQHFKSGGRAHFYAIVHNAAADYMFDWVKSSEFDLESPRHGIDISAKYDPTGSNVFIPPVALTPHGILSSYMSEVRIRRRDQFGRLRRSQEIYATTTHELTHAGHFKLDKWIFVSPLGLNNINERDLIIESWAEGVETIVTNHRYKIRFGVSNINYNFERQRLRAPPLPRSSNLTAMTQYTPLFIDLNDNLNQNAIRRLFDPKPPVDRVSGYTIAQMQESLDGAHTLAALRYRLRTQHDNQTEDFLFELFEYPRQVRNFLGHAE